MLTCALLCGRLPFVGETTSQLFDAIASGFQDLDADEWRRISPEGQACVRRMLERDASTRPTAAALLEDPWIRRTAGVDITQNLPQLRALHRWRTQWRRSVHAVRAVNIFSAIGARRSDAASSRAPAANDAVGLAAVARERLAGGS